MRSSISSTSRSSCCLIVRVSSAIKFGEIEKYDGDEILILQNGCSQIDISQYIYETIILAIPQKKIHPGVIDGSLNSEIIQKLTDLQPKKKKKLKKEIDPRWVKLKDLL